MADTSAAQQDFDAPPAPKPMQKITKQDRIRELYRLDELDKKLCSIINEHPTATYPELAALTGSTRKQVEWRLKKPAVRKRLDDMTQTKDQLISHAKLVGIRRLTALAMSKDEFVALQACKVLLAGELSHAPIKVPDGGVGVVYEVQIGPQGQVFQTMRAMIGGPADPTANPQGFPTTIDAVARLKEATG